MKILNKLEFKKLLNDNPMKKFVFLEWTPTVYISDFHISSGNSTMPGFGATTFDTDPDDDMTFFYDWSIDEYTDDQMFAVLSDNEIREIINLFSEVIKNMSNLEYEIRTFLEENTIYDLLSVVNYCIESKENNYIDKINSSSEKQK